MSYFLFLALFLGIPIVLLLAQLRWEKRPTPAIWQNMSVRQALLIIIALALFYTTPWDNYLVATRVWWYDPALVTGLTIG
ncbi:MAG: lycopene cyclase domain-containing protein, partial [Anaerolineales bacterium]|nr:lycopene cyclase domain-containing protein [Anaerolineales bacterium]